MTDATRFTFLEAAREWLCDGYSIDARYLQRNDLAIPQLWEGSIALQPLPVLPGNSLEIDNAVVSVVQREIHTVNSAQARSIVEAAAGGRIDLPGSAVELREVQSLHYYSDNVDRQRWFSPLHLRVTGNRAFSPPPPSGPLLDSYLRLAEPPFDGMQDLAAWIGFGDQRFSNAGPTIDIRISPPVDLLLQECSLRNDRLRVSVAAMSSFDTSKINLAVRSFPGTGLGTRGQVASLIQWGGARNGLKKGTVILKTKNAESALVMLTVGRSTTRRHWVADPAKAHNSRLAAMQIFDKDVKVLKQAILQPGNNASNFEAGIASLFFLLGFAPTVMLETNAPDLIVATPSGRTVLVECTIRIADFHAKLGKLIDRRGAALKTMQVNNDTNRIVAVLVCAQPRDQIGISDRDLARHSVLLASAENLATALEQIRVPGDPDKRLDDALAVLGASAIRAE